MTIEVRLYDGVVEVKVEGLNLTAKFPGYHEATKFIQALIINVKSY